ncbi:hypothetical protein ACFL1S_03245 [Pseudomonadota bacterium]
MLALADSQWQREGWITQPLPRDTRSLGDEASKPFIKDLFNLALVHASADDWILYTNTDCAIDRQLYRHLQTMRATAVEYMRLDVEGSPLTLGELFANKKEHFEIGLDGLALRAGFWKDIREHLPDFIIGEPHWDTTYSGILRRIIPVRRNKWMLYHPKHDQVWDIRNPTAGGTHNHNLYVDAVAYGHSESSLIEDRDDSTDTAVICTSFGDDPVRIRANMEGMRNQLAQDLYCDYFLIEAVPENGVSAYPQDFLSLLNHVPVPSTSRSDELFQKESLMNVGWKTALKRHAYDYFIFTDADIYSDQSDWFRKIRGRLRLNPSRAVQGFRLVRDTLDPNLRYSSLASVHVLKYQTDLTLNPGMCWATHRRVLEMGNGFNADCIVCSGDSAFVSEYMNWENFQYDSFLYQFNWFHEIERKLPFRVEIDCVPVDILHVHHGYVKDRNYNGVCYALDGLPPIDQLVCRDANGLLVWKDPDCVERRLMRQRHRMGTREGVDQVFEEFGYDRFTHSAVSESRVPPPKPLFESPLDEDLLSVRLPANAGSHGQADYGVLNLFNPVEVFRRDFPFSWCSGVSQVPGSTFIPINTGSRPFTLVLDGLEDAEYVIGVLPIQPSWEPFNLTLYSFLHITVQYSDNMLSGVQLALESKDPDGAECESSQISLSGKGVKAGKPHKLVIPIKEFDGKPGFQLEHIRLLKIIGRSGSRIEFSRIYFT